MGKSSIVIKPTRFGIRSIDYEFKHYPYPAYIKQGKKPSTDFVAALDNRVKEAAASNRLSPYLRKWLQRE